jgi:predicted nucleic acid-binding protein
MMSNLVVLDTSVLIDFLRTNKYRDQIANLGGIVRTCTVVLAELWRGANEIEEKLFLERLGDKSRRLSPTPSNWIESGQILAEIRLQRGYQGQKLRDLHFDILIALTARSHGALLITTNRNDFELIRVYRDFKLEVW